jgi:hypothetical protein
MTTTHFGRSPLGAGKSVSEATRQQLTDAGTTHSNSLQSLHASPRRAANRDQVPFTSATVYMKHTATTTTTTVTTSVRALARHTVNGVEGTVGEKSAGDEDGPGHHRLLRDVYTTIPPRTCEELVKQC